MAASGQGAWSFELYDGVWGDMELKFSALLSHIEDTGVDGVVYNSPIKQWDFDAAKYETVYHEYEIDFKEMTQKNLNTGKVRRLRRFVLCQQLQ